MAENLKDIATRVFRRANHDPSPTEDAVRDAYAFVNDAVQQIALEAPHLFFEERLVIHTDPDVESGTDADTITLVTETTGPFVDTPNPWVFEVDIPIATNGVATASSGQASWQVGGNIVDVQPRQWAGRMIDITTSGGVVLTTQIRSVWFEEYTDGGGDTIVAIRFSILTPWIYEIFGVGPFTYRVYTQDYYLPDDVIEMKSARVLGDDKPNRLTIIGQAEAEEVGYANDRAVDSDGSPLYMFRGQHFAMPAPNVAPTLAQHGTSKWVGPEPPGEFEYVFTYCWGRRRDYNPGIGWWRHEANEWTEPTSTAATEEDRWKTMRKREPIWESSPSPVASITVSAPTASPSAAAQITLPNIEYHLGFMLAGKTSVGGLGTDFRRISVAHSGWHIRVYRRRKTADFTNYTTLGTTIAGHSVPTLHKLDVHDAFYLFAELRLDEYNEGILVDDGSILPDYLRRLRTVNGYQGVRFWPRPDDEYDVEIRCVRRPQALVSPQDAPTVHSEAVQLVVELALAFMYDKLGEPQMAQVCRAQYKRYLEIVSKRYGDLRPDNVPTQRRPARAFGYPRGALWRWPRGGS